VVVRQHRLTAGVNQPEAGACRDFSIRPRSSWFLSALGAGCEQGASGGDRFVAGKLTVLFHFSVISYLMNLAGHRGFGTSEDRAWSA
jgi:hypothetical protein